MTFAYPWLLLLLIPYIFIAIIAYRRPKPTIKISNIKPYKGRKSFFNFINIPFVLYTIAIGLLIFALSRPRKGIEHLLQRAEGIDIMLAIDLSGSMQSIDVPGNITTEHELQSALQNGKVKDRLEVAKTEIKKFIKNRPNDRIGLIAFAPQPYVACPPTLDHSWLIENLKRLKPGIIGDATGIAGPIASAVKRLKDADSKRKVVVLFTDGSNNVNAKITPRQAATLAKTYKVIVYTVGIGSDRAFVLQDGFYGKTFFPVQSQFDEPLLKDLAKISDGRYYKAKDGKGLEKAMTEIDKLEKTSTEQPRYTEYKEWSPRIMWGALLLLVATFFLEHTIFLRIP